MMKKPSFTPDNSRKIELNCYRTLPVPSEYTDNYTWEIAFEMHLTEIRKAEQLALEEKQRQSRQFEKSQILKYDHTRPIGDDDAKPTDRS